MIIKFLLKILLLILTHTVSNRLISIPLAVGLFAKWYLAVLFIFVMDIIQIPFFYFIYESPQKIKFFVVRYRYWRKRINTLYKREKITRKARSWEANILKRAQKLGSWGVAIVSALPSFGGGMWSGVLLAHLLKLNKRKSYLFLGLGSLISCMLLSFGFGSLKTVLIYVIG